jgi:predicted transglutaminase-like cysteine proteinase
MRIVWPVVVLAGLLGATSAWADQSPKTKTPAVSPVMRTFGPAYPPYGFVDFCVREERECVPSGGVLTTRIDGGPEALAELDRVNRMVNTKIKPATDLELYGVVEFWTIPADRGDCEDYVLLKRHVLIERGWPSSALLITVVRDENGDGHAVLTARTSLGDFILDNKTSELKLWHQTGYEYLMRQSYLNPKAWVSLSPAEDQEPAPMTSKGGGSGMKTR